MKLVEEVVVFNGRWYLTDCVGFLSEEVRQIVL